MNGSGWVGVEEGLIAYNVDEVILCKEISGANNKINVCLLFKSSKMEWKQCSV